RHPQTDQLSAPKAERAQGRIIRRRDSDLPGEQLAGDDQNDEHPDAAEEPERNGVRPHRLLYVGEMDRRELQVDVFVRCLSQRRLERGDVRRAVMESDLREIEVATVGWNDVVAISLD